MESELKLTAECFQWFHNNYSEQRGLLVRVKNELDNHPYKTSTDRMKQLAENKATGIISGASDFYLVLQNSVIFVELKVGTGTQSEKQKQWELLVQQYGHRYVVIYSLEKFKELIWNHFGKK